MTGPTDGFSFFSVDATAGYVLPPPPPPVRTTADYISLITPFHSTRPRFVATVALSVDPLARLQVMLGHLPTDFDIDFAVGVQLDAVGVRVGRSRLVPFPLQGIYFSWDTLGRGWEQAVWKGPFDTTFGLYSLDDDTYRRLLYAKVMANSWDGTVVQEQAIHDIFFIDPASFVFVVDNYDMTMNINVAGKIPDLVNLSVMDEGLVAAKPEGVSFSYNVTSVNNTPLFGFDVENQYVSGWDVGSWGVSPSYILANPA